MTSGNSHLPDSVRMGSRPLRLVPLAAEPASTGPSSSPAQPATSSSLRRLQRDLAEAMVEARSLRELLEDLPAILERKFQQRLRALQLEQRQLEEENATLQQHLVALLSGSSAASEAAAPALPPPSPSRRNIDSAALTAGLGLRRALRRLHR